MITESLHNELVRRLQEEHEAALTRLHREHAELQTQHQQAVQKLAEAVARRDEALQEQAQAQHEVRQYSKLYDLAVMELERWRRNLFGQKAERVDPRQIQLVFEPLRKELEAHRNAEAEQQARAEQETKAQRNNNAKKKRGPRAERKLDLSRLPTETIVVPDPRVLAEPERWLRIGEEVSSKVEFRRASMVNLVIVRPTYVRVDVVRDAVAAANRADQAHSAHAPQEPAPATVASTSAAPSTAPAAPAPTVPVSPVGLGHRIETTPRIITAPLPEHPIPRCLAGPALLAHVIVSRFADHLPYHRLERRFAREGLALSDSTMGGWVEPCAKLLGRVVNAMMDDAIANAPWIAIDPTGVLVQQKEKCRRGYFWVMVAGQDHVFFHYSAKQNGDVPKRLLSKYLGYVQADAASVYHALFGLGAATEVGCWAHARRRFFEAVRSEKDRAYVALGFIGQLYKIDEKVTELAPSERTEARRSRAGPVLDAFKKWLDAESLVALPRSPLGEAISYALNQWEALTRFVKDWRLRLDNNHSERELRAIAVGRKNWLFVGTDECGSHAAVMVSLIASCRLHGLNPEEYLRDVLLLINTWPKDRVLQLAPKYWARTKATLTSEQRAILDFWPH